MPDLQKPLKQTAVLREGCAWTAFQNVRFDQFAEVMPRLHFTKGAFPGCSRAVLSRFFGGPRVTFNSNLKVTRAPVGNIPRFKPVICQGHGDNFWRKVRGVLALAPYGTWTGACGVLTWLLGNPGGVPLVPLRCPSISRSGSLYYNLHGDTQLLRDEFISGKSINPSINQSNNLGYFSFYKLCL